MERSGRWPQRPSPLCYGEEQRTGDVLRYSPHPPPPPPPIDIYSTPPTFRISASSTLRQVNSRNDARRTIQDGFEEDYQYLPYNRIMHHEGRQNYDEGYHYDDDNHQQDHFQPRSDDDRLRRSDDYPPRDYCQGRWNHEEAGQDPVEFVHHQSPVGPAVSVYPKDYLRNRQTLERRTEVPQMSNQRSTLRERGLMNAEAAKIAAFDAEMKKGKASSRSPSMVEIAPGVQMRLRGAAETLECVRRGFFIPCKCFSCDLEQFCIQDASCVLCPRCRVVNPVSGFHDIINKHNDVGNGGVALGFTMEDLGSIQMELLRERNGRHYC